MATAERPSALLLAEQLTSGDARSGSGAGVSHLYLQWNRTERALRRQHPEAFADITTDVQTALEQEPFDLDTRAGLHLLQEALPVLQPRAQEELADEETWQQFYRRSGQRLAQNAVSWQGLLTERGRGGYIGSLRGRLAEHAGILLLGHCYPASWREDNTRPSHDGYQIENGAKVYAVDFKAAEPYRPKPDKKPGVQTLQIGYLADHVLRAVPTRFDDLRASFPPEAQEPQGRGLRLDHSLLLLASVVGGHGAGDQLSPLGQDFLAECQRQASAVVTTPGLSLADLYPGLNHME